MNQQTIEPLTDPEEPAQKTKRKWFQFRLRTLLVLVAVVAGLLVAWRMYTEPYRRQRETMAVIKKLGGSYKTEAGAPQWMAWLFGADNFQDIVIVDLGGTQVTEEGLKELKNLKALTSLQLYPEQVTDAVLKTLMETGLIFRTNILPEMPFHIAYGSKTGEIREIQCLWLRDTTVTDVGLKELKGFKALTTLTLGSSQVTDASLMTLREFGLLHTLWCARAKDYGRPRNNEEIHSLDLSGTKVTDAGLKEWKDLKALTSLSLAYTRVTDAGLKELKHFKALTSLDLRRTQVTDAGLKELEALKSLTRVQLGRTRVSDVGVSQLKKSLPNCQIVR